MTASRISSSFPLISAQGVLLRWALCMLALLATMTPRPAAAQGFSVGVRVDLVTGASPYSVAIGDVSGDGKPDLAVANFGANTVSVLLGNGNGTFRENTDFTTGANPVSLAIGDMNRDGNPDLSVANAMSNTVSLLLGNGAGGFGPKSDFVEVRLRTGDLGRHLGSVQ